jgi:uncharacterized protein
MRTIQRYHRDREGVTLQRSADGSGMPTISGYASVHFRASDPAGTQYELFEGVFERILPGAFAETLKQDDVIGCFNHDESKLLGRTSSGTVRLTTDARGLKYEIDPPNTQCAKDVIESIRRGDISGSSFTFIPVKSVYREASDPNAPCVLERHVVRLVDVSPVTIPAYTGTDVGLRSRINRADALAGGLDSDEMEYLERIERVHAEVKIAGDRSLAKLLRCHLSVVSRFPASRYGDITMVRSDGTRVPLKNAAAHIRRTGSRPSADAQPSQYRSGPKCRAKINQLQKVRRAARSMSPQTQSGFDRIKVDFGRINSAFSKVWDDIAVLDKLAAEGETADSAGGWSGSATRPTSFANGGRSDGSLLEMIQRTHAAVRALGREAKDATRATQLATIDVYVDSPDGREFLKRKPAEEFDYDDYEFDDCDDEPNIHDDD